MPLLPAPLTRLASLLATTSLLACAGGLPHQRQARTAAATALGCPEERVTLKGTSSQMYYATGCSAGVALVCVGGLRDLECKPGTPRPLVDSPGEFCETYESPAPIPEAPTAAEYAAYPHHGSLSEGLVREQVHEHLGLVRACFGCAEQRTQGLQGLVTAHVLVTAMGRIGGVSVTTEPFLDELLTQCVRNVVDDYTFPPPGANGPFMTSLPFRIGQP